uniref:Uncharacterized protein n=1 Tax=Globisporangium ultimum (strain ATCC 200006 / CBS 805.95 / DAOM BR144) TaxID=431595 RepID=K3XAU3_GLOUD
MAAPATSSLVIRREKRRPRNLKKSSRSSSSSGNANVVRRGFVFQEEEDEEEDAFASTAAKGALSKSGRSRAKKSVADDAFVFRVKKKPSDVETSKAHKQTMDADSVSSALVAKKEKAQRARERKQRLVAQQKEDEREEQYESELQDKLSPDQMNLYQIVRAQVKREVRKTKKEFANSSARKDIFHMTEMSLQALKHEMVAFMAENPPADVSANLPNPENARLRAQMDTYEKRIKDLEEEEQQWTSVKSRIESEPSEPDDSDVDMEGEARQKVTASYGLPVAKEIEQLQRNALKQIGTTATKLDLVDDSVKSVDRLILQIEMKKLQLFDSFHDAAFKGYANMAQPKENLRALLKFAPPASTSVYGAL